MTDFLVFIGGLQLANEQKEDNYHFLVFTDLFGNRTHGVIVQYYRAVQVQTHTHTRSNTIQKMQKVVSH